MKTFLRITLLLLAAFAVALGIHALRGSFPAAESAAPASEIVVSQDADGTLRCYRDAAPCSFTGLVRDRAAGVFRYAEDGLVSETFCGFAEENGVWWYVDHGLVDFDRNDVVEGTVDGQTGLWYVSGGSVLSDYSGVTAYTDSGMLYAVDHGRVDPDFTGFSRSARGWWYVEKGLVDREKTGLIPGTLNGEVALWYVADGQVQLSFSGLAEIEPGERWYVRYGRAEPALTGVVRIGDDAWYCREGKVVPVGRMAFSDESGDWIVTDGRAEQVLSEEQRTYFRALTLVAEITDEDMTKEEKLRACFDYAKTTFWECVPRTPNSTDPGWHVLYANDLLDGSGGNCFSFGAAFAFMAKACGYDEVYCCNSASHGWAEIDGKVYDPEWSRHSDGFDIYALDYDSVTGQGYAAAIQISDQPGWEWMRVKI